MKNIVAICVLVAVSTFCFAQIPMSDYAWSYSLGTYTEITGGTSLGTTSTNDERFVDPAVPAGSFAATGPGFPIGFDFEFAGYVFDRVGINANGWITLGQSALAPAAVNISSTSSVYPLVSTFPFEPSHLCSRIAGFARDLQAQAGATLRVLTVGTSPNRQLVVQWKNYRKAYSGGVGDYFNFQIRLEETTNKIKIVYGAITNNATAGIVQVGLRGEPPTPATNWKNLTGTNWASPSAGTVNSATLTLSNVYFPASGTLYTWIPPVDGQPPYPAMVASPADTAVQVSPLASLVWVSGGQMPTGYNLYFGTTNPPALIGDMGAATSYNPGTLPLNTAHYWKIVPYNAYGSPPAQSCPVWSFTTHNGLPYLTAPADGASNLQVCNLSFSWANAPGAISHKIRIGSTSGGTDLVNMQEATTPYVLAGPLAYGTTYYWSVFSVYPDSRIEFQSAERTFTTRPAVTNYPYNENFGTTGAAFPPANWTKHNGVLANPTVLGAAGTGLWAQDTWLNTYPTNFAAACNIYGNYSSWLISPPFTVPEDDYTLAFHLALMTWDTNDPPYQNGDDDSFTVLMGDGLTWTPANVVRRWDNVSSEYVYNDIPNSGTLVTLPMGNAGTKYIAFLGVSTSSNADNDLMIDNIEISQTPHQAILTLTPDVSLWDFGPTIQNTVNTKRFTITNTGSLALDISSITVSGSYYSLSEPLTDASLDLGESAYFSIAYAPTVLGSPHTGSFTISDNRATRTVDLAGSCYDPTVSGYPYGQNFDGTWNASPPAPYGWRVYNANADDYTWKQDNVFIAPTHSEPYAAHGMGNTDDWLVSPPFDLAGASTLLKWWDKVESASYPNSYKVLLSTSGPQVTSFTIELGTYICSNAVWTEHTVSLGAFTGQTVYVAFYQYASPSIVYGFGIDDVSVSSTPTGVPEHVLLTAPVNGAQDLNPSSVVLHWTPVRTVVPTYYEVFLAAEPIDPENYYWGERQFETYNNSLDLFSQPGLELGWNQRWYWAVMPHNGTDAPATPDPDFLVWFFETMPDPTVEMPYYVDFSTSEWPEGWTQTVNGSVLPDRWAVSYTSMAGASPYEIREKWDTGTGVSRLISKPVNTTGVNTIDIRFKHFWDDYEPGIDYATATVEYSYNLVEWHNTGWTLPSGGGNTSGTISLVLSGLNSPITYIAWTVSGMHFFFDYWYLDDILISVPVAHNALPLSFDFPEATGDAPFSPVLTVLNSGDSTESFAVQLQIGTSYLQTQTMSNVPPNTPAQLSFPPFTPVVNTAYELSATTLLAGDMTPGDDVLTGTMISLPLNVQAFCDVGNFPDNGHRGPSTVWLNDPANVTDLSDSHTHTFFLRGSTWMNGGWYAPEYSSNYWFRIDPATGAETFLGVTGVELASVAYDSNHGILYGAGFQALYTMNPLTGAASLIGSYNLPSGTMVGIAYDATHDILYGIDLAYDALYSIDPATGTATLVGPLGVNLAYAQDCSFDQVNGYLYLAGYRTNTSELYWINTDDGSAWKVANFTQGYEITSFAIPYPWIPEVAISGAGTLSWPALGVDSVYNIYGSDDPASGFVFLGSTAANSWTDTAFPQAKRFYRVTRDISAVVPATLRIEGHPFAARKTRKAIVPLAGDASLEQRGK